MKLSHGKHDPPNGVIAMCHMSDTDRLAEIAGPLSRPGGATPGGASSEVPPTPALCELCGHPMPPGEEMFTYHGYSGPCPTAERPEGRAS